MNDNLESIVTSLKDQARSQILSASDSAALDAVRVQYLGKKGELTLLLHQLKELDADKRKEKGAILNLVKIELEKELSRKQSELERTHVDKEIAKAPPLDLSLPGYTTFPSGSLHPVSRIIEQIVQCLKRVGFSVVSGPEVELEFYNFEALNTPDDHPARDLQDTFYINPPVLLRSHTSPMQIRAMKSKSPPIQILAIGKVYRSDYDLTHTPMFHQVEGLMVDDNISLADLKGTLHHLVKSLFGSRALRFRPSFFPFVEPGAEVDMQCIQCKGASNKDCRLCKSTGWLEIGGCGMVHPNVFKAVGYDHERYTGFAFGMGIERIAMLKYGIDDLRSFFENDYRMLEQF